MADIRAQLLAAFDVEHREHLEAIRRALASPATADLREVFRRAHSLKGAARAVDLPAVEELAHRLEDLFARLMDGRAVLDAPTIDDIHLRLDTIESQVASLRDGPPAAAAEVDRRAVESASPTSSSAPAPAAGQPSAHGGADIEVERQLEFVRIEAQALRELSRTAHQLATDLRGEQGAPARLRHLHNEARRLEQRWGELRGRIGARELARGRDLEHALKGLVRGLGDLARSQARVNWALETGVGSIQQQIEQIALTPAETVLGDLGRMVRDLARQGGIEVEVQVAGLEVRAERRVLQALRDPLIQLLRNALSHGAEPRAARLAAGKPERMLVGLEISARAGRIQARVYDDGPGPDLARIEAAAVERGLLPQRGPDDPAPSADELLAAAFQPGVSSARAVDRLAGRGMGLSIVMEAVRGLGGAVRLAPRAPSGAEVVLSAPLSMARQTVVLVEAESALYALPSFGVERLLRLNVGALEFVEGAPTARIEIAGQDVLTPVVSIASLIDRRTAPMPVAGQVVNALLLSRGERRLAVAVDALVEVREMAIEPMRALGMDLSLTLGAGLLEDDTPVVALDPDGLVERWLRDERRLAAAGLGLAQAEGESARARTVLVVDDSITTRTLEKSILEAQGYRVILAVDGLDALNTLRSGEAVIDLVVADIEMPRMDGFGLLQAIKADATLSSLPVILMTSRNDPEDVRRGMDLGAEAYITKQKFDQRELLATIGRIL